MWMPDIHANPPTRYYSPRVSDSSPNLVKLFQKCVRSKGSLIALRMPPVTVLNNLMICRRTLYSTRARRWTSPALPASRGRLRGGPRCGPVRRCVHYHRSIREIFDAHQIKLAGPRCPWCEALLFAGSRSSNRFSGHPAGAHPARPAPWQANPGPEG